MEKEKWLWKDTLDLVVSLLPACFVTITKITSIVIHAIEIIYSKYIALFHFSIGNLIWQINYFKTDQILSFIDALQ